MTPRNLLLLSALMTAFLLSGCKERDVPYIIDEDEIRRSVTGSAEGKELFSISPIVLEEPYTLPFNGAIYRDSVLSRGRAIEIKAGDSAIDYGSLGFLREALVRVTDSFSIRTRRIFGTDTSYNDNKRIFVRHGFYLKLGDDSQPYVGWVLYGFNGYNVLDYDSTYIKLNAPNGTLFYGDNTIYNRHLVSITGPYYIRLSEMKQLDNGSKLRIEVKSRRQPLLTYQGASGPKNLMMTERSNTIYIDTIQTPTNNPRFYNLIMLQPLNDTTGAPARAGIFIPYKVP